MRISLEFNSVKEMKEFYEGVQFVPYGTIREEKAKKADEKAPKPSKNAQKTEKVTKETSAPTEDAKEAEEEITIVDVRKLLSIVNKKTGKNTAKEWIREEGFESLADVEDQTVLQRLFKKAEEVINNAE